MIQTIDTTLFRLFGFYSVKYNYIIDHWKVEISYFEIFLLEFSFMWQTGYMIQQMTFLFWNSFVKKD